MIISNSLLIGSLSGMGHYSVRTPQISHETIDGETVIINLDNGNYYSIDGVGADIWNLLSKGADEKCIINILEKNFEIDSNDFRAKLDSLISEFLDEGLIKKSDGNKTFIDEDVELISLNNDFEDPVLHKYTDMQDLLLLDPIHEVDDDTGWPTPKDSEKNS